MKVFSTIDRSLVPFEPNEPGKVGMYVCGPTVQASPHIGHGRQAVVVDVIRRYLEWAGFDVTYVRNVTDVEDKIIAAAREREIDPAQVAAQSYEAFASAYRRLGIGEPTIEPRATEHVPEMIELIETLVEREHAYEAEGDVYFAVRSFADYGKLSGHDVDDLRAGSRVEPGEHKRDPLDFALWKAAKPGEPSWDSPWGPGRPGWHIECSAMSRKYLGDGFDIHTGGQDLVFPHHENEIAQSEAAYGPPLARYWLHNGLVNLSGEKMSKSTGHLVDLLEALDRYEPTALRLFYLRTHYRKPLDFSDEALRDAEASLERLWAFRRRGPDLVEVEPDEAVLARFTAAMDDDFDVAGALSVLFEAVRDGNRVLDQNGDAGPWLAAYDEITSVLGLAEPVLDLSGLATELGDLGRIYGISAPNAEATVATLLERRAQAREDGDWTSADDIRDRLAELGIVVEDTSDGVRWHRR